MICWKRRWLCCLQLDREQQMLTLRPTADHFQPIWKTFSSP